MSELRTPTRWLSDDSGNVPASFLDAAQRHRADGVSPQARARIWDKLERNLAASPVPRGWQVPWRGACALLLAGAGAMLAVQAGPSQDGSHAVSAFEVVGSTQADTLGNTDVGTPPGASALIDDSALIGAHIDASAPAAVGGSAPGEPVELETAQPMLAAGRGENPSLDERAKPRSGTAAAPLLAAGDERAKLRRSGTAAAPLRAAGDERAPRRSGTAGAPLPAAGDEVGLLVRARRLLQAQPGRALELTTRHSVEYPRGLFVEERELLAIEALCQLGRRELANQRIAKFSKTFPGSAHQQRIEALRSRE